MHYNLRNVMIKALTNPVSNWIIREIHYRQTSLAYKTWWQRLHIDPPLLIGLLMLMGIGLLILYSAASANSTLIIKQMVRLGLATGVLLILAQIPPRYFSNWAPWLYGIALILLIAVLIVGTLKKGAIRWLDLGIIRFQPSELMKLAVPLMLAKYVK